MSRFCKIAGQTWAWTCVGPRSLRDWSNAQNLCQCVKLKFSKSPYNLLQSLRRKVLCPKILLNPWKPEGIKSLKKVWQNKELWAERAQLADEKGSELLAATRTCDRSSLRSIQKRFRFRMSFPRDGVPRNQNDTYSVPTASCQTRNKWYKNVHLTTDTSTTVCLTNINKKVDVVKLGPICHLSVRQCINSPRHTIHAPVTAD